MTGFLSVLLAAAVLLAPDAAAAQDRIVVRPEPGTPVVAAEILVAAGPADEADGQAGVTYLAARAVTAPILPVLDSLAAHLEVEQHRDAVSFTVIAAPDTWEEATRTLLVALFRDPVDSVAAVRERAATVAELTAREASPADALRRELDRAVFGARHAWGRPAVGTAEGVAGISVRQVDAFVRAAFTPDRAVAAIVGPVAPDAGEALAAYVEPGRLRRSTVDAPAPADAPVSRPYDAITAWVAAVYPFPADADEEALRMLARMAIERVSFGPARPQVYDSRAEVVRHAAGGEVRLQLVVPPREVEQWAGRLAGAVSLHAEAPLEDAAFAERLRRHRGERLLELASPEARARFLARQVLLGEAPRLPDLDQLTPGRLHQAARALRRPVIVYLGPFQEPEGDG